MVNRANGDLSQVLGWINDTIGAEGAWKPWPGGWQADIESALIDSVFSARAVYKTTHGKGVYYQVTSWQVGRTARRSAYSLSALADEIRSTGVELWAAEFGNTQRSPKRAATARGGPSKAAAVLDACEVLLNLDPKIDTATDVCDANLVTTRSALRLVDGIGYATANYFTMLLGYPGVKPDRMIHRFLRDAIGHDLGDDRAAQLIAAAARHHEVSEQRLDHAIWNYESKRAASDG